MNLPNFFTLIRIVLIPFFLNYLVAYRSGEAHYRWIAFGLFCAASLTDAIDGFLARVLRNRTRLGTFLDPLADKLLLLTAYIGIVFVPTLLYRPPFWVIITIVFRDVVIIAGLILLFLINGEIKIQPNLIGKTTTALQMVTLIAILLESPSSIIFWYLTAVLTILSCIIYARREWSRLQTP